MKDRTNNYVPDIRGYHTDGYSRIEDLPENYKPSSTVLVGDRRVPVVFALPDEHNREPSHWLWADFSTEEGRQFSHFMGHRVLVDVSIKQTNRRVVNDWKGLDEIRGDTAAYVSFDGIPVWEEHGTLTGLLHSLPSHIEELKQLHHLIDYIKGDESKLIDRPIYYREQPAFVRRFIGSQGCVIIERESGLWDPVAYRNGELELDLYERREPVKDSILSPHIWWWRDVD